MIRGIVSSKKNLKRRAAKLKDTWRPAQFNFPKG